MNESINELINKIGDCDNCKLNSSCGIFERAYQISYCDTLEDMQESIKTVELVSN